MRQINTDNLYYENKNLGKTALKILRENYNQINNTNIKSIVQLAKKLNMTSINAQKDLVKKYNSNLAGIQLDNQRLKSKIYRESKKAIIKLDNLKVKNSELIKKFLINKIVSNKYKLKVAETSFKMHNMYVLPSYDQYITKRTLQFNEPIGMEPQEIKSYAIKLSNYK